MFAIGHVIIVVSVTFGQSIEPTDALNGAKTLPKSFRLRMQVEADPGGTSEFRLVHQRPNKWRSVTRVGQGAGEFVVLCDGRTLWSYTTGLDEYSKVDVATLVERCGEDTANRFLKEKALLNAGIISPFYAGADRWRKEVGSDSRLARLGEEKLNDIATIVFELSWAGPQAAKFQVWYGKDDRFLRRQVLYRPDGTVWITCTAKEVELNPQVKNAAFKVQLPNTAKIIDDTANVLRELTQPQQRSQPEKRVKTLGEKGLSRRRK